jgi:predicted ATPase
MGASLLFTGHIVEGREHYDHAIALYDPKEHPSRVGVAVLTWRAVALWLLGYPQAALADSERAVKDAHDVDEAATLMFALGFAPLTYVWRGDYTVANTVLEQVAAIADEKGAFFWGTLAMMNRGVILALAGKASDAIAMITAGITTWRRTGATLFLPWYLSCLARTYAELGQFDDAWRRIHEATTAIVTTKESWCEAEVHRTAGEIALMLSEPDAAKAEAYFERALTIARAQKAKSWELRVAMSMARMWRDQGRRNEARDLLASVYGWFTEGFDTLDLKKATSLLDELRVHDL